MPIDINLNKILKEMWRLDEKISLGEVLSEQEVNFYDNHLNDIQQYYLKNDNYWQNKKNINS